MCFKRNIVRVLGAIFVVLGCDGSVDDSTKDTFGDSAFLDTESETDTSTGGDAGIDAAILYENMGICGLTGEAAVTEERFNGAEERYLIADEGEGADLCRVRFEVLSIGTPTVPCELCEWTFLVETRNPTVIADEDGQCGKSALGLDDAQIAAIDGEVRAIGYVVEYVGHTDVLVVYDDVAGAWQAVGAANLVDGAFYYSRSDGFCGY